MAKEREKRLGLGLKSVRVLDMIAARPDGMALSEIQLALAEMTYGRTMARKILGDSIRGWWCTNLLYGGRAILRRFCDKGPDGRWRRNGIPHLNHPFSLRFWKEKETKTCPEVIR